MRQLVVVVAGRVPVQVFSGREPQLRDSNVREQEEGASTPAHTSGRRWWKKPRNAPREEAGSGGAERPRSRERNRAGSKISSRSRTAAAAVDPRAELRFGSDG